MSDIDGYFKRSLFFAVWTRFREELHHWSLSVQQQQVSSLFASFPKFSQKIVLAPRSQRLRIKIK